MKNIGDTLKELREKSNLTIRDVEKALNDRGIKVSNKTIYGWERERSMPNVDIFMFLCEIYNCNDILGNFGYRPTFNNNFLQKSSRVSEKSSIYKNLILKYDNLDEKGKHTVNTILEMEYNRCQSDEQATTKENDNLIDISIFPDEAKQSILHTMQVIKFAKEQPKNEHVEEKTLLTG